MQMTVTVAIIQSVIMFNTHSPLIYAGQEPLPSDKLERYDSVTVIRVTAVVTIKGDVN
jgi:hypothetical protein